MRRLAALLLLAALATCASPQARPNYRFDGPVYDAAAISRLEIEGVRLGMTQNEACAQLVARGFRRHHRTDCRAHDDLAIDDGFILEAAMGNLPADRETVRSMHLRYELVAGRQVVIHIGAYTNAPNQPAALVRTTIAAWGPPTFHGHYADNYVQMIWAESPRQADPNHRSLFGSCTTFPECEWERGIDCAPILRRYATPAASAVVYDWGRWLTIEDHGAFLRDLRRSGDLARRPWRSRICTTPPIH